MDDLRRDLVIANHILAHEGILDAFGHVSIRHPENPRRADDEPVAADGRFPYLERFIHAAIYDQRPDVMAICHNHTTSILPFSISKSTKLRPVIHTGAVIGGEVPVWDIADEFGADTNLLVVNMAQGRSLARALGNGTVALMRGHGSLVASISVPAVVSACVNLDKNARVQMQAMLLGDYTPLAPGEIARPAVAPGQSSVPDRGWEAYVRRIKDPA